MKYLIKLSAIIVFGQEKLYCEIPTKRLALYTFNLTKPHFKATFPND